eukprot:Hpha_TRINITY_DN14610_c0_g1::TRINITY_DN14610_c0_g1_i3::g.48283::m.48283
MKYQKTCRIVLLVLVALLLLIGQPTTPPVHPLESPVVDSGKDQANVLFVHMRGLVLSEGCDVRLGQVMLEAQRRGWKPHYFHFNGSQPASGSNKSLCGTMVKDWAKGRTVAGLPRDCAYSVEAPELCLNAGMQKEVQGVEGLHVPEYVFPGNKDERFCDGLLAVLQLMSVIRFRAVIAPVWFWNHDAIPGHLFPAIREVLALPSARQSVRGKPLLLAVSDDAHTARESLLASTETCDNAKMEHLQRRHEVNKMERRAYASSDAAVFISHADLELSRDYIPKPVAGIVSNMVVGKVSPIPADSPGFADRQGFFFLGNGMNPTNYQGTEWFLQNVWPLIRKEIPKAYIVIVGLSPRWGHNCIELKCHCGWHGSGRRRRGVRGYGTRDAEELLKLLKVVRVMVVPVLSATGVITKNFEAYRHHLPLVLTEVAARGLDRPVDSLGAVVTKPGDAKAFAEAAIRLHESEEAWNNVRQQMNTFALNDAQTNDWFEDVHKFIQTGIQQKKMPPKVPPKKVPRLPRPKVNEEVVV